jgi:hypothetical protein
VNVEAVGVLEVYEGGMWLSRLSKMFEVCKEYQGSWKGRRYVGIEVRRREEGRKVCEKCRCRWRIGRRYVDVEVLASM